MEEIFKSDDYTAEQSAITEEMLGNNHVFFLPYLMGERSPINDTNARGTFVGMTMDTSRAELLQAVLEGVAFAIRDSIEVARNQGIELTASKLCGGGAKSKLWQKMMANILNMRLELPVSEQGPGMGAAMLAMVCCGAYDSVEAVCESLCETAAVVEPDAELVAKYEERYQKFKKIYPAMKTLFKELI